MARTIRDVALGYSILQGPDGVDGFAIDAKTAQPASPRFRGEHGGVGWVFDAAFETLASLGPPADEEHAIDSTIVRAHEHAAGVKGESGEASSRPLARRRPADRGEVHETQGFDALMELRYAQPAKLLGDKGYDSDEIRNDLAKRGIEPVIPPRSNRTTPIEYDREAYGEISSSNAVPPHRDPLRKNCQDARRSRERADSRRACRSRFASGGAIWSWAGSPAIRVTPTMLRPWSPPGGTSSNRPKKFWFCEPRCDELIVGESGGILEKPAAMRIEP
jgi:hypothetical protein